MKKNVMFTLAALGAASMLCGFDSAETADSISLKMQEASQAVIDQGMSMKMDMNLDGALNISDDTTTSTIAMAIKGGFDIDYTMDPFAMKMVGNMDVSALGEGQSVTMQTYAVTGENGELETYTYSEDATTGESGWAYAADDSFDMNQILELSKSMDPQMISEYGLTFELAPEAADVDGTECYLLTTTIDKDTFATMINKTAELTGEAVPTEELNMVLAYFDGLKINVSYYVDVATYLPVSMHMDMNGSDLSTLNSLLATSMGEAAEGTSMELVMNDCSIDASVAYGNVEPITVPQEALDAVASGAAASVDVDEVMEGAESEMLAEAETEAVTAG